MGRLVAFSFYAISIYFQFKHMYWCLCLVVAFHLCVYMVAISMLQATSTLTRFVWHMSTGYVIRTHRCMHTFANVYKLHGTPSSSICHHGYHQFSSNRLFILKECVQSTLATATATTIIIFIFPYSVAALLSYECTWFPSLFCPLSSASLQLHFYNFKMKEEENKMMENLLLKFD